MKIISYRNDWCGLQLQHVALYCNAAVAFTLAEPGPAYPQDLMCSPDLLDIINYAFMDAFEVTIILGTQSSHLSLKSHTGEQVK
jgi:hypothetical protein